MARTVVPRPPQYLKDLDGNQLSVLNPEFHIWKVKYQELITLIKTQPCHLLGCYISFGGRTENCNISSAYSEEWVHFYSIIRTSILKS